MRHGKKDNHLGRTTAHRAALLSNLASSLILNKRIETTLAKAKELRKFVEPIITRSKEDTTHSRRTVFSYLQNKEAIKELFSIVAEKVAERPGGYTRIIKLGTRLGDNAEVCLIELVDFNESLLAAANADEKKKTRRGRRRGGKGGATTSVAAPVAAEETAAVVETPAEEAPSEETTDNEAEKSEE